MATTVLVLAAVIRRGDTFLLCRRPLHKRHGGLWEFPGGKLEPGESQTEAARRELREELAVEVVAVGPQLFEHREPGSEFLIQFVATEIHGDPTPVEHEEVRWVPSHGLLELRLAPSDAAFVAAMSRSGP